MSRIWIDTTELSPMSRRLSEHDIEIAVEARTASGKLASDLIAVKKLFILSYSFITNEILGQLAGLYRLGGARILKIEREDKTIDQYQVKFRPFSRDRYLTGGKWYWENITIELEEV